MCLLSVLFLCRECRFSYSESQPLIDIENHVCSCRLCSEILKEKKLKTLNEKNCAKVTSLLFFFWINKVKIFLEQR